MSTRRSILVGAAAVSSVIATRAYAQGLGSGSESGVVKMVVGFPPGGITDAIGRLVAEGLGQVGGRQIIVENRGGAAGNIASAAVARAKPDGTTLLIGAVSTHAINPRLYKNLTFDGAKDFTPIAFVARAANVLIVNPKFPPASVAELIAYAKGRAEPIQMAVPGYGTTPHMAGELLKRVAGIDIAFIPYKGGAPALTDVMAGVVPIMFEGILTAAPQLRGGTVRALGISSPGRSKVVPEVPAIAETLPGFDAQGWWAIFAPAGMLREMTAQLHKVVTDAVRLPAISSKLNELGCETEYMTQEQLAQLLVSDTDKWGRIIKESNIAVE